MTKVAILGTKVQLNCTNGRETAIKASIAASTASERPIRTTSRHSNARSWMIWGALATQIIQDLGETETETETKTEPDRRPAAVRGRLG